MRKQNGYAILTACVLGVICAGCSGRAPRAAVVAEGVILSLEYKQGDDKPGGFTRMNLAAAVPGGDGSWNVDAYGRLTRDYLIITRLQRKDLEPEVIPASRIVSIQFGDGGIKTVNENQTAPAR